MNEEIVRLDDLGRGICYVDGKITFVPKTVVGDIVNIKIIKEKSKYNEGNLIEIVKPSPKRLEALCPYFNVCGGCDLQNISYEDSILYKKDKVINLFKRNGLVINPEIIKSTNPYNYRNKITLKVREGNIGFYESKSHKIVEIKECIIARKCINDVIPFIHSWNLKNGEVTIRCNQNNEILIVVDTKDSIDIDVNDIKGKVKLCGIVINNNIYYGDNFLFEIINGIVFKISYNSFFQVNPEVASKLFQIVVENIDSDDTVLDLYSGVGTISLQASKKAKSVVGVEIIANAVLNSVYNANINKITNAKFLLNDATLAIKNLNGEYNTIVVDPPRAGLTKEVVEAILTYEPKRLIYVSCDMHTLVRDILLLSDKYNIKKSYVVDMFSNTYHVENICILERKFF